MIIIFCKIIKLGNANYRLNNEIYCCSCVNYIVLRYITYTGVDYKERYIKSIC